jgi:hypothetical protein
LELPDIISRTGGAAVFAAEEFFLGTIRNEHTRKAYLTAIKRFFAWAEKRKLDLVRIAPKDVGQYFGGLQKQMSIAILIYTAARAGDPTAEEEVVCILKTSHKHLVTSGLNSKCRARNSGRSARER